MREYKKVVKTYDSEEISKCICDKCGKECVLENKDEKILHDKRTIIFIKPQYTGGLQLYLDLCPNCTRELLKWFPKNEETEDFLDILNTWEND